MNGHRTLISAPPLLSKPREEIGADCLCTLVDLSVEAADWGQEIVYHKEKAAHPHMERRFIANADEYDKVGVINPKRDAPYEGTH